MGNNIIFQIMKLEAPAEYVCMIVPNLSIQHKKPITKIGRSILLLSITGIRTKNDFLSEQEEFENKTSLPQKIKARLKN